MQKAIILQKKKTFFLFLKMWNDFPEYTFPSSVKKLKGKQPLL